MMDMQQKVTLKTITEPVEIEVHLKHITSSALSSALIFFHLQPTLAKPNSKWEWKMRVGIGETRRF